MLKRGIGEIKLKKLFILTIVLMVLIASSVLGTSLDQKTLGDENAPVTINMFTDLECPFCARWHIDTFPLVKQNYIDTGKAKLIVRHYPLSFHLNAKKAAIASECAAQQGKFFEYIDLVYANQDELNSNDLRDYASNLGLDLTQYDNCIKSDSAEEDVEDDIAKGSSVSGTPTFYINGNDMVGAQPYENFRTEIERALNNEVPTEEVPTEIPEENENTCQSGCAYNGNCLPIGTRVDGQYCHIDGSLQEQKLGSLICENSFECKSNSCLDSACVEVGFWQRLINWLSQIMG